MVFIRADANEYIGTGHVMRCLSIAKALQKFGEQILFITADNRGDILIRQAGFNSICLNCDWTDMDSELNMLKSIMRKNEPCLMLIDDYYVTEKYFRELSNITRLAYIDDMNSACWDVDYLINYNIFASVFDYSQYEGKKTRLLLGPQYAPLREEFQNVCQRQIGDRIENVLVSAGGADPEKITEKILEVICKDDTFSKIKFHFIAGALNPRIELIKSVSETLDNVVLHINEQHMAELMQACDIALSASGTTLYELCACGLPTITYTLADNQLVAADEFQKQGIMINAGDCRRNPQFFDILKCHLLDIIRDSKKRRNMSRRMRLCVDGNGSSRLAERLLRI